MKRFVSISAAVVIASYCATASAATKVEERVDNSIEVFQSFTDIPEKAIPASILRDAHGIAILPGVIKVGFTLGGRFGRGVLMVRQEDGSWSNPAFVSLGGGSLGFQIGAQSTDIVLVFRDRRSIDNIYNGKLTLGGDASAAAGPVGRQATAATDERLGAEIFSYSRNRGLFAGVALDGAWIGMDKEANETFYGNGMTPEEILAADNMPSPLAAGQLVEMLAAAAPSVTQNEPRSRSAMLDYEYSEPAVSEVQTYGLEPIEDLQGPPMESEDIVIRDETMF